MKHERRVFNLSHVELRAAEDGDSSPGTFRGHAAVFNTPVRIWDWYEQVAPTAFDRALEGQDDVRLLFNHDANHVLARSKFGEGTLRLSKDEIGLVVEAELPDTTMGRDLAVMLERGDVDQMSFGFRAIRDSWEEREIEGPDGEAVTVQLRTLEEVELYDVSPVTFPAYPTTDAQLASIQRTLRYLGVVEAPEIATPPTPASVSIDDRAIAQIAAALEELRAGHDLEERVGKVLSRKNRQLVKDAITQSEAAIAALRALLDAAGDEDEQEPDDEPDDEQDEDEEKDEGRSAVAAHLSLHRRRLALLEALTDSAAL